MSGRTRVHVFVFGKVQGVFFRENTRRKAHELGITGWVRNLSDGRVEAVFEGGGKKIEELTEWLKRGPMFSRVDRVNIIREEYQAEFDNFEIKREQ
jgi:acylphosphatase